MDTLVITSVPEGNRSPVVRAITDALEVFNYRSGIGQILDLLDEVAEDGEAELWTDDDTEKVDEAAALLNAASICTEIRAVVDDEGPAIPDEYLPSDGAPPASPAHEAALIIMYTCEGNPTYALTIARGLQRVTGDETWQRVCDVLLSVFPARPA